MKLRTLCAALLCLVLAAPVFAQQHPQVTNTPHSDISRTDFVLYATGVASGTTGTETAITLTAASGTAATTTGASLSLLTGSATHIRITSVTVASRGNATATAQVSTFNLRLNTSGAVTTTTTPLIMALRTATPATALAYDRMAVTPAETYEIVGTTALQIGLTANAVYVTNAPTWDVVITGYIY